MREKTDKSKLKDGRGILNGNSYEAWKTARESKSVGTACAVYDPIQKRTVNLLSVGEKKTFWVLRFLTPNRILEQVPMDAAVVSSICEELGVRRYSSILSTDFLVENADRRAVAISVKPNASSFDTTTRTGKKNITRNDVEVRYWAQHGVPHHVVFADEIDMDFAMNIKDVMTYWDDVWVNDPTSMLMHMIARHVIQIPLDKGRIPFRKIAETIHVEDYYEAYKRQKGESINRRWRIDLSGKYSIQNPQP